MKDKLLEIFNWYGSKHQLKKLKEEHKELKQAIKWYEVARMQESNEELVNAYKDHVAEEIADNLNVIGQYLVAYDIPKKKIEAIMNFKLDRQLGRMEKEKSKRIKKG